MKLITNLILVKFADTSETPEVPDYMYHATNHYNAADISESGLKTFLPNHGTEDQHYWPDGKREKSSYFSHDPKVTESFAPAEGRAVKLRVPFKKAPFLKEKGTGDFYSQKSIKPEHVEYQHDDGSWKPISKYNEQ